MLEPMILEQLNSNDDPGLWEVATQTILTDAAKLANSQGARQRIFSQVGCCSHWIRPHWVTHGGLAWPFGYDKTTTGWSFSALPDLNWSVFYRCTGTGWEPGRTAGRCHLLRIAVPARTARHLQATVHTIWTPRSPASKEKLIQLYGFSKVGSIWRLATTEVLRRR